MSQTSSTPSMTFNKVLAGLSIAACAVSVYKLANNSKDMEERPVRTMALLAAYGYMGYRNTRTLISYHAITQNNAKLPQVATYKHQSQLDWDFGRTALVVAAEHLSAQPEAKLFRGAFEVAIGAYCIRSAYKNKKLGTPQVTDSTP